MNRRELLMLLVGTLTATRALHAQQKAMPVIGFLGSTSPNELLLAAFHRGLSENGYVDGKNLAIEYRWAEGQYNRLPALAADLVGRKVDVIVTPGGGSSALPAKGATSTIPIVSVGGDLVAAGLITSLARPGGNLTGISIMNTELPPKRLELLSELVPNAGVIALLVNPDNPGAEPMMRDVQEAARSKGLQLPILRASTVDEIDAAFASLGHLRAGALLVGNDPFFASRRDQLVALASRHAVPAMHEWRETVEAGGLITMGRASLACEWQRKVGDGEVLID